MNICKPICKKRNRQSAYNYKNGDFCINGKSSFCRTGWNWNLIRISFLSKVMAVLKHNVLLLFGLQYSIAYGIMGILTLI